MPEWGSVGYRMPLFFFVSGFFFRQRPFKVFLVRRLNTIFLPFLFFYVFSVLVIGMKYEIIELLFPSIDYISIGSFDEYALSITHLIDIYAPAGSDEFAAVPFNVALWFLPALFFIQLIFYGLKKHLRRSWLIVAVCGLCYLLSIVQKQHQVVGPFFLPRVMEYLIYYGSGCLFGQKLVDWLENADFRHLLGAFLVLSGLLYAVGFRQSEHLFMQHVLLNLGIGVFIPLVFIFFKAACRFPFFRVFGFFGRNSLVVLSLHLLILSILDSTWRRILPPGILGDLFTSNVIKFIIIVGFCSVSIFIFNRFFPRLVGKKDLIKLS